MSTRTLQILNIIGFVLAITLNGLAIALPINGITTGELSDLYPNLFVPAGFTFSIWSVIYTLLLVFVIYQARSLWNKKLDTAEVQTIGIWFFISCLANASWILAWHYKLVPLSLLIMLAILVSLIFIYQQIRKGQTENTAAYRYLVKLPFSIYLGWITVATIANVTTLFVDLGLSGFWLGEIAWTSVMISIATIIGAYFLIKKQDVPYALVLIWAFYGITAARSNSTILTIAYIGMALLAIGVLLRFSRWIKA